MRRGFESHLLTSSEDGSSSTGRATNYSPELETFLQLGQLTLVLLVEPKSRVRFVDSPPFLWRVGEVVSRSF